MQHLKLLHPSKEKHVSCDLCSKKFTSKTNLKFHIDKVHPREEDSENNGLPEADNDAIIDLGSVFDDNLEQDVSIIHHEHIYLMEDFPKTLFSSVLQFYCYSKLCHLHQHPLH